MWTCAGMRMVSPLPPYTSTRAPRVESLEVAQHVGAVPRVVVEGAAHDVVEVCAGGPCVRFVGPGVPVPRQPLVFPEDRAVAFPRLDAVQEGGGRRSVDPPVAVVPGLRPRGAGVADGLGIRAGAAHVVDCAERCAVPVEPGVIRSGHGVPCPHSSVFVEVEFVRAVVWEGDLDGARAVSDRVDDARVPCAAPYGSIVEDDVVSHLHRLPRVPGPSRLLGHARRWLLASPALYGS